MEALEEVDRVLEDFGVEGAVVFGVDVGVPLGGECVVEHGGLHVDQLGMGYTKLGLEDEADVGLLFGGGRVRRGVFVARRGLGRPCLGHFLFFFIEIVIKTVLDAVTDPFKTSKIAKWKVV